MPTAVAVGGRFFTCVYFLSHDISKTDAARITKLDIVMFHDECRKLNYFGVKRLKVKVTSHKKTLPVWIFALL